jgi:tetratricopeptide (TPR) repeat protein
LAGRFSKASFPALIQAVFFDRRTGILWLTSEDLDAALAFIQGNLVDAFFGAETTPSGPEEAQRVVDMVLAWDEGSFAFEARELGAVRDAGLGRALSTGQLVLNAVRAVYDSDALLELLGDPNRPLALSPDPLLRFQKLDLSASEGYILSRVDGTLSANEIAGLVPVPAEDVQRSLAGLLTAGVLVAGEPPPKRETAATRALRQTILDAYAGLARKDDWEVLGLARGAGAADVRAAYRAAVKRFHPDALSDAGLSDTREQAAAVFERVTRAFEALSKPHPAASAESHSAPGAEPRAPAEAAAESVEAANPADALRDAETHLAEGQPLQAITLLQRLVSSNDTALRQRAQLALARAYMMCADRTRQAEELLLGMTREEPHSPEAHFALGSFYKQRGLNARATAMFRKVLALRPGYAPALAELQTLAPAEQGSGLLSRLIKRG